MNHNINRRLPGAIMLRRIGLLLLSALPVGAMAHGGHGEHGFGAGLLHPLTGIDHLIALVAVGWWSAVTQSRGWWVIPLGFAATMLAGACMGLGGASSASVETAIVLSLVLFGALLALRLRLSLPLALAVVLPFALMHGYAHGQDMPAGSAPSWLVGMVAGTLALHLLGAFAGARTRARQRWVASLAGVVTLTAGVVLAVGLMAG